jgi:GTP cyclohydrolase III
MLDVLVAITTTAKPAQFSKLLETIICTTALCVSEMQNADSRPRDALNDLTFRVKP